MNRTRDIQLEIAITFIYKHFFQSVDIKLGYFCSLYYYTYYSWYRYLVSVSANTKFEVSGSDRKRKKCIGTSLVLMLTYS